MRVCTHQHDLPVQERPTCPSKFSDNALQAHVLCITCSAHEKVWSGGVSVQPLLLAEHRPHSWLQYGYCSHETEQPGCQETCNRASCRQLCLLIVCTGGEP